MKVLFCIPHLATGGAERVMSILANKFVQEGNEVEIVLLSSNKLSYHLDERVNYTYAGAEGRNSIIRRMIWLRKYVKSSRPNVIVVFLIKAYCMVLLSLFGLNIPVVASERIDPRFIKSHFWKWLSLRLLPMANHLVVQTQHIKNYYPLNIQAHTSIIFNPVSDVVFDLNHTQTKPIIVTAGRLYPQKNHKMLIKAFSLISTDFPDYQLHIYGEGPCKEELKTLIKSEGLTGKVILKGRSENVISEMNKSLIFCLSSDYEGMSNSLIEAYCLGLPIVTTDVSGVESFIKNGINALVVKSGDTKAFASAMHRLLSDDKLRKEMSSKNKGEGKKFHIDGIFGQWNKLLESVVRE